MLFRFKPWVSIDEDTWRRIQAIQFERQAAEAARAARLNGAVTPNASSALAAQLAAEYSAQKQGDNNKPNPFDITRRLAGNIRHGELLDAGGNLLEYLNLGQEYVGKPVAGTLLRGFEEKVDPRTGLEYRDINWRHPGSVLKGIGKGLAETAKDLKEGDLASAYKESREAYTEGIDQNPHVSAGVKVGLGILTDPTTYIGPGVLKAAALKLGIKAGPLVGLLDNLLSSPRGYALGAAIGGGLAAEAGSRSGIDPRLQGLFTLGGSMVGGGLTASHAELRVPASVKETALADSIASMSKRSDLATAMAAHQHMIDEVERQRFIEAYVQKYGLSPEQADQIVSMAAEHARAVAQLAGSNATPDFMKDLTGAILRQSLNPVETAVDDVLKEWLGDSTLISQDTYVFNNPALPGGDINTALSRRLGEGGYTGETATAINDIVTPHEAAILTTIDPNGQNWYRLVGDTLLDTANQFRFPTALFFALFGPTSMRTGPVDNLAGTYRWAAVLAWATQRRGGSLKGLTLDELKQFHDELIGAYWFATKGADLPNLRQSEQQMKIIVAIANGKWEPGGLKAINYIQTTEAAAAGMPGMHTVVDTWEGRPWGATDPKSAEHYLVMDRVGQHIAAELGITPEMRQAGIWSGMRALEQWGQGKTIAGRKLGSDWFKNLVEDVEKGRVALDDARAVMRAAISEFVADVEQGKVKFEDPMAYFEAKEVKQARALLKWVADGGLAPEDVRPELAHATAKGGFLGKGTEGNKVLGPEYRQQATKQMLEDTPYITASVQTKGTYESVAERPRAEVAREQIDLLGRGLEQSGVGKLREVTDIFTRHGGQEDLRVFVIDDLHRQGIQHFIVFPGENSPSLKAGVWEGNIEPNFMVYMPVATPETASILAESIDRALDAVGRRQEAYAIVNPRGEPTNVQIALTKDTPWTTDELRAINQATNFDVQVSRSDDRVAVLAWWYPGAAEATNPADVMNIPAKLMDLGYRPEGFGPGEGPKVSMELRRGSRSQLLWQDDINAIRQARGEVPGGAAGAGEAMAAAPRPFDEAGATGEGAAAPRPMNETEATGEAMAAAPKLDEEDYSSHASVLLTPKQEEATTNFFKKVSDLLPKPVFNRIRSLKELLNTRQIAGGAAMDRDVVNALVANFGPHARAIWKMAPEDMRNAFTAYMLAAVPDDMWKLPIIQAVPTLISKEGEQLAGDYRAMSAIIRIAEDVTSGDRAPVVLAHELAHHLARFMTEDEIAAAFAEGMAGLKGGPASTDFLTYRFIRNEVIPALKKATDEEYAWASKGVYGAYEGAFDLQYRWKNFNEYVAERILDAVFGRDLAARSSGWQKFVEFARTIFYAIGEFLGITDGYTPRGYERGRDVFRNFIERVNREPSSWRPGNDHLTDVFGIERANAMHDQWHNAMWRAKYEAAKYEPKGPFLETLSGHAGPAGEPRTEHAATPPPAEPPAGETPPPSQPPPDVPKQPPEEGSAAQPPKPRGGTLFGEEFAGGLRQTVGGRPVEGKIAQGLAGLRQKASEQLAKLDFVHKINPNLGRKDQISRLVTTARQGFRNIIDTYEGYADLLWTRVEASGLRAKFDGGQWVLEGNGVSAPFGDVAEAAYALMGRGDPASLSEQSLAVARSLTPDQRSALAALAEFNDELNHTLRTYSGTTFDEMSYFPRYVSGVDGTPRVDLREFTQGSSKIRTHSTFMEPRQFMSQLEGAKAGIEYAHPAKAYRLMVRAKLNVAAGDFIADRLKVLGLGEEAVREAGGVPGVTHVDLGGVIPSLAGVYFDADQAERILAGLKGHDQWNVPALSKVNQVLTPLRAVADVSWMLQQGSMLLFRHPTRAVPAMVRVIRSALGDPGQYASLMEDALADGARRAGMSTEDYVRLLGSHGLHLAASDIGEIDVGFSQGGVKGWREVKAFSNETYARYLNYARVVLANDVVERAVKTGDMDGLRGGLEAVNRMFGFTSRNPTSLEKTLMFAPRFLSASVEQVLAAATKGGLEGSVARRHLATLIGVGAGLAIAANSLRGYDTELDPRDPNFLRIRNVGGLDVSLFGTYSTLIRAIARTASGDKNALGGFLEGKLSPALQLIYYPLKGRTYLGEPLEFDRPVSSAYKIASSAIPFSAQSMLQEGIEPAIKERDPKKLLEGAMSVLASGTGATNTPLTPVERRNFARTGSKGGLTFAGKQVVEGKVQKPGIAQEKFGQDYEDLTAAQKAEVNRSPEVEKWQEEADKNALTRKGERSKYVELKLNAKAQVEELGQELLAGRISGNQYRERYQDIQMRLAGARDMLEGVKGDKVLSEWFDLYDKARGPGGILDFEKLEQLQSEFRQKHPDVDERLLKEIGVSDDPVLAAYRAAQKVAQKYYAIPRWQGMTREQSDQASRVLSEASAMVSYGQARSIRQAVLLLTENDPELRQLALRAARSRPNPEREKMRKSEPLLALFYSELAGAPRDLPGP
jgi:hypothetical protein